MSFWDSVGGDVGAVAGGEFGLPGAVGGWVAGNSIDPNSWGGSGSGSDDSVGYSYGPGGNVTGANITTNGASIPLQNPGSVAPGSVNPYAQQYLNQNQAMYQGLQGSILSPSQYGQLQSTSQTNLTTSLDNQYARMGLSGSSAEMGGLNNAIQSNQMNWMNRQQSDYSKYLSAGEGLTGQGYQETMGVQGQYGNFQDVYGQDVLSSLGMTQQQQMAQNQMLASMIGSGMGAGGQMAGMGMYGNAMSPYES